MYPKNFNFKTKLATIFGSLCTTWLIANNPATMSYFNPTEQLSSCDNHMWTILVTSKLAISYG